MEDFKKSISIKANDFLADVQEMLADAPEDQKLMEISYPNGEQYIGQIKDESTRQGKGLFKYANGDTYFGDWVNDTFHGKGKEKII